MVKKNYFLLKQLVLKDLKMRYAGSTFGFLWAFAQPLLQLALFTFVFSTILKIPLTGERGIESFSLFLFAGLLPWMAIQESLVRSTTGVQDNVQIIQKAIFPPAILVVTILISAVIHEVFALAAFLVILALLGKVSLAWVLLPLLLIVQVIFTFGLALILFCVQVFFRDTVQIVTYLMMVWFYFTPIVYPLSLVQGGVEKGHIPHWVLSGLKANPVTVVAEAYRDILLRGEIFSTMHLAVLTLAGIGVSWGALKVYRRLRPLFADVV